jgi:hypothetical protein
MISWFIRKQATVALLSIEAENMGPSSACCEAISLGKFIAKFVEIIKIKEGIKWNHQQTLNLHTP